MNNLLYKLFGKYDCKLTYLPKSKATAIDFGVWLKQPVLKVGQKQMPNILLFEFEFKPLFRDQMSEENTVKAKIAWRDFQFINSKEITWRV